MNSIIAKYREIKEDNPLRIAYSKRKENMVTNYNTDTLNDCPKSTFRTVWGGERYQQTIDFPGMQGHMSFQTICTDNC